MVKSLDSRQSLGWPGFPNLISGHQVGLADIGLAYYAAFKVAQILAGKSYACMEELEKAEACCGCTDMNEVYGYSDIDCPDCNPDDTSGGQNWPHASPLIKRDTKDLDHHLINGSEEDGQRNNTDDVDVDIGDLSAEKSQELRKRVAGTATLAVKKITVVTGLQVSGPKYPSFPSAPNFPWEGIQNGQWDAIDRYYGNASANCENWSVVQSVRADTELSKVGRVRAKYNSMNLFLTCVGLECCEIKTDIFL